MGLGRNLGSFHQSFDSTLSYSTAFANWPTAHINNAGYQEVNGNATMHMAGIASLPASARIWQIIWKGSGAGGTHGLGGGSGAVTVKPFIGATNISCAYTRGTGDGGQLASGVAATVDQDFSTSGEGNPQTGYAIFTWTGSQTGAMNTGTPTGAETGWWPGTIANDLRMNIAISGDGVTYAGNDSANCFVEVYAYLSAGGQQIL